MNTGKEQRRSSHLGGRGGGLVLLVVRAASRSSSILVHGWCPYWFKEGGRAFVLSPLLKSARSGWSMKTSRLPVKVPLLP